MARFPLPGASAPSVRHLVASLDKFSVPAKEKDEVLALVGTLKKDIVEKP